MLGLTIAFGFGVLIGWLLGQHKSCYHGPTPKEYQRISESTAQAAEATMYVSLGVIASQRQILGDLEDMDVNGLKLDLATRIASLSGPLREVANSFQSAALESAIVKEADAIAELAEHSQVLRQQLDALAANSSQKRPFT